MPCITFPEKAKSILPRRESRAAVLRAVRFGETRSLVFNGDIKALSQLWEDSLVFEYEPFLSPETFPEGFIHGHLKQVEPGLLLLKVDTKDKPVAFYIYQSLNETPENGFMPFVMVKVSSNSAEQITSHLSGWVEGIPPIQLASYQRVQAQIALNRLAAILY